MLVRLALAIIGSFASFILLSRCAWAWKYCDLMVSGFLFCHLITLMPISCWRQLGVDHNMPLVVEVLVAWIRAYRAYSVHIRFARVGGVPWEQGPRPSVRPSVCAVVRAPVCANRKSAYQGSDTSVKDVALRIVRIGGVFKGFSQHPHC